MDLVQSINNRVGFDREFRLSVTGRLSRQHVKHLELLFDLLPDIYFYVKDDSGRWVTCNIASLGLLSLTRREEILGAREEDFFPPQVAAAILADDMNVINNRIHIVEKHELIANEKGQLVWVITNKLPILNDDNQAIGLVGMTHLLPEDGVLPAPLERFRTVISHIENNLEDKIRVPDLARMANMSESHFRREFKNNMGLSAQEFILRARLQTASRLIATSDQTFTIIALQCGFTDQSYFTRQFTRFFGQSPKRYRLRWRSH